MILSLKVCLTMIGLATLHSLLLAQGKDIELVMNNGAKLENLELVFVRDTALIGLGSGNDDMGFIRFSAGEKALVLGVTLGAAGLLIGLAAGAASSTPGRKVEPLPGGDLSVLKPYARYPRSEP